MNLIEDIIEELADSTKSLSNPLLKTKILASRIGNKELLAWADNELKGYKGNRENLPEYRHGKPTYQCTLQQGYAVEENAPLPIMLFKEDMRERLIRYQFDDSVTTLENQANGESGDTMYKEFGADMCTMLTSQIQRNDVANIRILKMRVLIHVSQLTQVLSVIRSKLLDFILALETELPDLDDKLKEKITVKKEEKEQIERIFNQTIINAGEASTITTGSHNTVTTNYNITKGNLESLETALRENHVSQEDISEIVQVVQEEKPDMTSGDFGPKTSNWLKKMYQKSVDGSWQVGIATAGGLLVELLKMYFGMK